MNDKLQISFFSPFSSRYSYVTLLPCRRRPGISIYVDHHNIQQTAKSRILVELQTKLPKYLSLMESLPMHIQLQAAVLLNHGILSGLAAQS